MSRPHPIHISSFPIPNRPRDFHTYPLPRPHLRGRMHPRELHFVHQLRIQLPI